MGFNSEKKKGKKKNAVTKVEYYYGCNQSSMVGYFTLLPIKFFTITKTN